MTNSIFFRTCSRPIVLIYPMYPSLLTRYPHKPCKSFFDPLKKLSYTCHSNLFRVEDGRRGALLKKASTTSSNILEVAKPRHSGVVEADVSAISRAKMRSVQQTVTIVLAYVVCSTPFIYIQLWAVWGSPSKAVRK